MPGLFGTVLVALGLGTLVIVAVALTAFLRYVQFLWDATRG